MAQSGTNVEGEGDILTVENKLFIVVDSVTIAVTFSVKFIDGVGDWLYSGVIVCVAKSDETIGVAVVEEMLFEEIYLQYLSMFPLGHLQIQPLVVK